MLTLKTVGKHKAFVSVGLVVLLMVIGASILLMRNSNNPSEMAQKDLTTVIAENSSPGGPDEAYTTALARFVETTDNLEEKAKAYKKLADGYSIRGDFRKALDAYKKAQELVQYGQFTDDEKEVIRASIISLENQVKFNDESRPSETGGYKEPDE